MRDFYKCRGRALLLASNPTTLVVSVTCTFLYHIKYRDIEAWFPLNRNGREHMKVTEEQYSKRVSIYHNGEG